MWNELGLNPSLHIKSLNVIVDDHSMNMPYIYLLYGTICVMYLICAAKGVYL